MKSLFVTYPGSGAPPFLACSPDSAVISRGNPWFVPVSDITDPWSLSLWCAAVISRLGKSISVKFAPRYFSECVLAAHPFFPGAPASAEWLRDGAVVLDGPQFVPGSVAAASVCDSRGTVFAQVTLPDTDMLARAVADVSAFVTLRTGDLVLLPVMDNEGRQAVCSAVVHNDIEVFDPDRNRLLRVKIR